MSRHAARIAPRGARVPTPAIPHGLLPSFSRGLGLLRAGDADGAELALNAFETLTLAPIDRRLIAADLLTADERAWLDGYHARVARDIGPLVDAATWAWLNQATLPLT